MSSAADIASGPLARDSADLTPRVAAGRAEWHALSALAALREDWVDLSRRAAEPNVFYDPAFALAAAPVFGNPGAMLVWSKSGKLIGLFPARAERRYGVTATLTGWTHAYAPFGVPLIDRDETEAAIAAFLDQVETSERLPKLIMLPFVAMNGTFAATLAKVLLRRGGAMEVFHSHQRAQLAPTGDRRTYLDRALAHKKLKELRRQRRRLLDRGQLKTLVARDPDAIPRALSDHLALEAAGWKGRRGSAAGQDAAVRGFIESALGALARDGNVRIERLMQNNHALATTITLQNGSSAWFWKVAYDEDFARHSPGVQATLDLTEHLLAEPNVLRVDSCASAGHAMIDHLWRERLSLGDLLIAPSRAALAQFRIARHLETLRRALETTAKAVRNGLLR
ncbi:MAG: GNAT family N-acetyltransferase [Alphaproteobacteria bacterium]|nr:GNAT family N-acetyltransferase [Alphaproteobacteria bacterium]